MLGLEPFWDVLEAGAVVRRRISRYLDGLLEKFGTQFNFPVFVVFFTERSEVS